MRYVCLFVLMIPALFAQPPNGQAIYEERCASCHNNPEGRVPSLETIKQMTGEEIYRSLTSGVMKSQAEGLGTPELFSLIGYIGPAGGAKNKIPSFNRTCEGDAAFSLSADQPDWAGWSPGVTNSRFQSEPGIPAGQVGKLKLKWAFNLGTVTDARSHPAVAGGRVFISSGVGAVYSLDAASGCTYWGAKVDAGPRGGIALSEVDGQPLAIFADGAANVYALNAETGEQVWKVRHVEHFIALITGTPQVHGGVVYLGVSSAEEAVAADPKYNCCTFRGSVMALDAATGKLLWKTYTIPEPKPTAKSAAGAQQYGPSGAAVWSAPTIDEKLGVLYVATGDNYSAPSTDTSDAVIAMDLESGKIQWVRQLFPNDVFNNGCTIPVPGNCPDDAGPDYDFGQPPILVELEGGSRALVIGQKSGMVHAIDPDNHGEILWQTQAGKGGALGGSQWGSAADTENIYTAISNAGLGGVPDPSAPAGFRLVLDPKQGGGLHALNLASGEIVWSADPAPCPEGREMCSPAQSAAVTAIPGAVFSGSIDGHLRAYSAKSGEVLWDFDTARKFNTVNAGPAQGGSLDAAGPAIVGGMLFVNSGYGQWGGKPGNVLLAFGLE